MRPLEDGMSSWLKMVLLGGIDCMILFEIVLFSDDVFFASCASSLSSL